MNNNPPNPTCNTDLTDVERDWLIRQLEAWPTRVDPEKTTNIEYLMKKAAALLVSGEGRQDFSRLTLRHNIETILQQWRDAHPNTLLDKIMSAIPRVSNRSGVEILDWLADHSNLELCCAPVEGDLSEEEWQVHRVNGGYNDREWNLVGRGLTPLNALQQARTALDTENSEDHMSREG